MILITQNNSKLLIAAGLLPCFSSFLLLAAHLFVIIFLDPSLSIYISGFQGLLYSRHDACNQPFLSLHLRIVAMSCTCCIYASFHSCRVNCLSRMESSRMIPKCRVIRNDRGGVPLSDGPSLLEQVRWFREDSLWLNGPPLLIHDRLGIFGT